MQKIITRLALEPVNIIAETANPDIPLDVVENANNALIRNKISNAVFWDVNQTIRQAQELTRQFPGFSLTVYNTHTDMPADLRQRVEAAGRTPSRVQAFIMPDSNDVILIANKVPPSQVARLSVMKSSVTVVFEQFLAKIMTIFWILSIVITLLK